MLQCWWVLATLCPIWPAWDLNLRSFKSMVFFSPLQRRTRYRSTNWPVHKNHLQQKFVTLKVWTPAINNTILSLKTEVSYFDYGRSEIYIFVWYIPLSLNNCHNNCANPNHECKEYDQKRRSIKKTLFKECSKLPDLLKAMQPNTDHRINLTVVCKNNALVIDRVIFYISYHAKEDIIYDGSLA